jgi:hypothetical protein
VKKSRDLYPGLIYFFDKNALVSGGTFTRVFYPMTKTENFSLGFAVPVGKLVRPYQPVWIGSFLASSDTESVFDVLRMHRLLRR